MKITSTLLLLLLFSVSTFASELAGTSTAKIGETVFVDVTGEPVFDSSKTVGENLEVFRAWLATTKVQASSPDGSTPLLEPDVQIKFSFTESALTWDMRIKFVGDKSGTHVIAASVVSDLLLHRIEVGGVPFPPKPDPTTAPWSSPGLSVLILRESQTMQSLPVAQRAIFTTASVHQWLTSNTIEYRILDDDSSDISGLPQVMQDAYKVVKAKMVNDDPIIGISNGITGYVGPLPANIDELLALVEQYK